MDTTVPIRSARHVIDATRVAPAALCDAVAIDPAALGDDRARIPIARLVALYEAAASRTGDSAFGLHVGEYIDLRAYGVLGYLVVNSATLGDALDGFGRYLPLWTSGATLATYRDGGTVSVVWEYAEPALAEHRHDTEMSLAAIATAVARACRGRLVREVHFRHRAPRAIDEHRRMFGPRIAFATPTTQLVFDRASLATPFRDADLQLRDLLAALADGQLAACRSSWIDRAEIAIRRGLADRDVRVATIARRLGATPRTLQRRLAEHGMSYGALLARARCELAEHLLATTELSLAEIAHRLGYATASELHRRFRAWTGTTPGRYRAG